MRSVVAQDGSVPVRLESATIRRRFRMAQEGSCGFSYAQIELISHIRLDLSQSLKSARMSTGELRPAAVAPANSREASKGTSEGGNDWRMLTMIGATKKAGKSSNRFDRAGGKVDWIWSEVAMVDGVDKG